MHALPRCLAALLILLIAVPALQAADKKPNVLFIAVDDLRPELGCYGVEHIKTPAIDKLAESSLVFDRAYCQQAVCNPSRASILSGCRPPTTKVVANNQNLLDTMPGIVTLPRHFKNHGYHTASIGKIFHVEGPVVDDAEAWSEPSFEHKPGLKSWYTPESMQIIKDRPKVLAAAGKPTDSKAARRGPPYEGADMPDDAYNDHALAERAIETLRRVKDKPFFLALGFQKPHLPYCCPKKYFDLYPLDSIEAPPKPSKSSGAPAAATTDPYELRSYGSVPLDGPISPEMQRRLIQGYRACVSFMDAQVGLVLDELERLELADDTIVVLWGDHGYHLGENAMWTKMTNFEWGARVPLIVRVPGKNAGKRSRALVELVDLYATLSELCGLDAPSRTEGLSFAPVIEKPNRPWKTAVFSEYTRPKDIFGRSVRTADYRYNEWTGKDGESLGRELYDENADPGENHNLIDDPKQAQRVAELKKVLDGGWREALPIKKEGNAKKRPVAKSATVALAAVDGGVRDKKANDKRPDVLVILCDQWSPRYLSWDNPQVKTPNLDRIAHEGTIFDACYTPSPVCMPARVSLITGLYPHNAGHEIWGNAQEYFVKPEAATMFQDIQRAGYTTAQIGKLHWFSGTAWRENFKTMEDYHRALGLDYVVDVPGPPSGANERNPYALHLKKLGLLDKVAGDLHDRYVTWEFEPRVSVVEPENYHDVFVANAAVDFIAGQPADKPMCVVVSLHSPHPPLDAPGKFATMYEPQKLRLPDNVPSSFAREKRELDQPEVRRMLANYLGKISLADECMGRVISALEKRGAWNEALVVMTADHGEMMGAHGALTKGKFYDESARVPLVVRLPGRVKTGRIAAPVQSCDIYPTIVEAIGGELSPGRFAKSLLPVAEGKAKRVRNLAVSEIGKGPPLDIMARGDRYKYWMQDDDEYLFDMQDDPLEMMNLAKSEEHRETLNRMREELLVFWRSTQVNHAEGYIPKVKRLRQEAEAKAKKE